MQKYDTVTPEVGFHFSYPRADNPVFTELKELADIDLGSETGEIEKAKIIIGYAHGLFSHDGDSQPSSFDPLTIIKEAKSGKSFRCVEYSFLAMALLWAHGIPARTVGLKTADVETREYGAGHVVVEFWSRELNKWIMSDVQAGIIPKSGEALLSAYELAQSLHQDTKPEPILVNGSRFGADAAFKDMVDYISWVQEYLYFFDTPITVELNIPDLRTQNIAMLVPLGVETPKMFQGLFTMNAIYTHSVLDFYPKYLSS
jgi:hypothetical protein